MSSLEVIEGIVGIQTTLEETIKVYASGKNDIQLSEPFVVVGQQLPVLLQLLQDCKCHLELRKDSLSQDSLETWEGILDSCDEKARKLSQIFKKVISCPGEKSAWRKRYTEIIRRYGRGNTVDGLMTALTQGVRLLVNSQEVSSASSSQNIQLEHILSEVQLHKESRLEEANQTAQTFNSRVDQINNFNQGSGQQINNNAPVETLNLTNVNKAQRVDFSFRGGIGIYLGQAPCMPSEQFIGRVPELASIPELLYPDRQTQHRVQIERPCLVLSGPGGIGKTQIAITYARTPRQSYQSVLWMDASSKATLKGCFQSVSGIIFGHKLSQPLDSTESVTRTIEWLSDSNNTRWLLIFDSYDHRGEFELEKYYPPVAHGAIIVTTRRPDVVHRKTATLEIKPLPNADSFIILQSRSKRENIEIDMGAKQLVERLAGLPLALATAGAFLRRRRCSFEQYLQKYEEWNVDPRRSVPLEEYQGQKLWTTWDISYDQLKKEDKDAAQMLKLLAYFGNQKIWYGYLCAGLTEDSPLHDVIADEFSFDGVMEVLTGYNFLEYHPKFEVWSMHNCIHDWTLATLNKDISSQFFWYAFECAARSIRETYGSECMSWFYHSDTFNTPPFACIVPHAVRLCQPRFIKDDVFSISSPNQLEFIVDVYGLLDDQFELITEGILLLALPHCQRIFGPTHEFTLNLMSTIGWSYRRQGCFDKACKFLLRAVTKLEETLGLYNTSTLSTIVNLSVVYISQGNLSGATDILSRTIAETRSAASEVPEEEWSCRSKLLEIHTNLALAYMKQGNELEAESILKHVIDKREKTQGKTHMSTLVVHMNLGAIYQDQGKSENSERIFRHILDSTRKFLSPDHPFVLSCTFNLGEALYDQGKIEEAQKLFHDALCGYEKTIGGYDERTLKTAYRIGKISEKQGDIDNAERMYERALAGFERSLGPEHEVTIDVLKCLGILYLEKHQMKNAEDMLHRSLRGSKKGGSVRGASILALAIGARYLKTAQLDKAERMHLIALEGFQKDTDANDSEVGAAAMGLWVIYLMKGDRIQAERMRNLAEPVMSQVSNSPGKS